MTSQAIDSTPARATMMPAGEALSLRFERFAGLCAFAAGVAGFLYAVSFIVLRSAGLSGFLLLLGGLFSTVALIAVFQRLRAVDASFALLAAVLSVAGALGAALHGGYDLANAINPPSSTPDLPSEVDPRGLLTFGVAGLGLLLVAWLIGQSHGSGRAFPGGLGILGYVLAALLVVVYLARLTILDATSLAIVIPAALTGFLINPAWYVWLGLALWRDRRTP